jgi:hypothetical protein
MPSSPISPQQHHSKKLYLLSVSISLSNSAGKHTPENVRIQLPQEGIEGTSIAPSIPNIRDIRSRKIQMLQPLKNHILSKIHLIGKRLIRSQEPQICSREIWSRETGPIISMLENNTNTMCSHCQIVEQAFLQVYQTSSSIRLSRLQDDHWSAGSVVCRIEPVSQIEEIATVRFVEGIVVEVVDWDGEVVGGVEKSGVRVSLSKFAGGYCCSLELRISFNYSK